MNLTIIKKAIENLPKPFGKLLINIPFGLIVGPKYYYHKSNYLKSINITEQQKKDFIYTNVVKIVKYAIKKIPFYKNFYGDHNFDINQLKCFDDIQKIPLISKTDLQSVNISERSKPNWNSFIVNTGGTSGQPLNFYLDKGSFAFEWAHMHTIWSKFKYSRKQMKLTFRGKNIGSAPLKYSAIHNEYLVNAYYRQEDVIKAIKKINQSEPIYFFHGYPSLIYEFVTKCEQICPELIASLSKSLKGVFLSSEYPHPLYRDKIEKLLQCKTISWYGHSEMCILAYEQNMKYLYEPMFTYGYCEAIKEPNGLDYQLVGTSYSNFSSPFIRYKTGDLIRPQIKNGMIESFEVTYGRNGDFIFDINNNPVSLTALIFGRHHKIFNQADFIQVYQECNGRVKLFITISESKNYDFRNVQNDFDAKNINCSFDFIKINKPIRTAQGKTPLLVNKELLKINGLLNKFM